MNEIIKKLDEVNNDFTKLNKLKENNDEMKKLLSTILRVNELIANRIKECEEYNSINNKNISKLIDIIENIIKWIKYISFIIWIIIWQIFYPYISNTLIKTSNFWKNLPEWWQIAIFSLFWRFILWIFATLIWNIISEKIKKQFNK